MGVPQSVRSLGVLAVGTGVAGGLGYRVPEPYGAGLAPLAGVAAVLILGWIVTDGRYLPLVACLATIVGGAAVAVSIPSRAASGWLAVWVGVGGLLVHDGIVGLGRVAASGGFSDRRRGGERLLYPFGLVLYGIVSLGRTVLPGRRRRLLAGIALVAVLAAVEVRLAMTAPAAAPIATGLATVSALGVALDGGTWQLRGGPRSAPVVGVLWLAVASLRGLSVPTGGTGATATASSTGGGHASGDPTVESSSPAGTAPSNANGDPGGDGAPVVAPGDVDGDACQNCGATGDDVETSAARVVPGVDGGGDVRVSLCTRCRNARGFVGDRSVEACRERTGHFEGPLAEHADRCVACGTTAAGGTIEGHAVVPPSLRGHVHRRNVVPLCRRCHEAAH